MATFLKIVVREAITERVAGEVSEHRTAPSASLTSVGLFPIAFNQSSTRPYKEKKSRDDEENLPIRLAEIQFF